MIQTLTKKAQAHDGLVEVAPGVFAVPPQQVGHTVLARFHATSRPGCYALRPLTHNLAVLDHKLLDLLGMSGKGKVIHRLAEQGYIKLVAVSPRVHQLDLDSWMQHLQRVQEVEASGKEFWNYPGSAAAAKRFGRCDTDEPRRADPAPAAPAPAVEAAAATKPAEDRTMVEDFIARAQECEDGRDRFDLLRAARDVLSPAHLDELRAEVRKLGGVGP